MVDHVYDVRPFLRQDLEQGQEQVVGLRVVAEDGRLQTVVVGLEVGEVRGVVFEGPLLGGLLFGGWGAHQLVLFE